MQVFITGIGIISGIGIGADATFESLKNGKSGIKKISHLKSDLSDFLVSEVKAENAVLKDLLEVNTILSRTSLLGAVAAKEATKNLPSHFLEQLPFITGTTVGGMDMSEIFYKSYLKSADNIDHNLLATHDCGDTSEKIAEILGIRGFISTISTACSSSANSIMVAGRLLQSGKYSRAIAGGSDALTNFTINGFNSLKIYDNEFCKPFDNNRAGLNLGEGAAYLLLETEDSISETGNQPLAILSGWGNANDAYHQTASSPDGIGATMAMKSALKKAGLAPTSINYINAHGTGTPNNDLTESKAIINVFGDNPPSFSSTKSFTGHTLAASGAIEAVFSVLCLQYGSLLPNLNFSEPTHELGLIPVTHYSENNRIENILSNSFGFGGNNTSLIFRKS